MIIKERLYVDASRQKVVKEGSKQAAFLLCAAGQDLPDPIAEQYGLKQKKTAPANKQAKAPANKSADKE